jgi:hypothetical protein
MISPHRSVRVFRFPKRVFPIVRKDPWKKLKREKKRGSEGGEIVVRAKQFQNEQSRKGWGVDKRTGGKKKDVGGRSVGSGRV